MKNPLLKAAARCLFAVVLGASTSLFGQPTPVLHLSFDNVDGTSTIVTNTGSGVGMDAYLQGTASIVPGGRFGNALQVTGTGSAAGYAIVSNAVVPLNVTAGSAWTVALWIKSSTMGGSWAYQGDGSWNANMTTLFMALNGGSTGNNSHSAGGVRYGQGWMQGTAVVDNGQWHQIVLTFDGANKVQYVDGILDAWQANGWAVGTGDNGAGTQFWVGGATGSEGDGQVGLQGLVDEAYVFDVALQPSDIVKLYDNNDLSITPVPVAVTVSPKSGLRGSTATITATATPAAGTATNAVADLSAFGLTNAFQLVLSDTANVFTNSFTVPANAAIGLKNVIVTVKDTEPLVGSGATNFFVLATPPTTATVVTELTSQSVHQYTEVSFHFAATNNAVNSTNNAFFPMSYFWYTNGVPVSTNAMGPYYTFLCTPGQTLMPVQCIAKVNDDTNYYSSLSVTSAAVTLTVTAGTPVYNNGLKRELFANVGRDQVELGDTSPGQIDLASVADVNIENFNGGVNYVERFSGYFVPPADGVYVFFVTADDDSDLFFSTNSDPANKQLIAQENNWSNPHDWLTDDSSATAGHPGQKSSATFTNSESLGVAPYAAGFTLVGGQQYYIEAVHHQGGGGGNLAITYDTTNDLYGGASTFVNGMTSGLDVLSNTVAVVTWPGTGITWSSQPKAAVTVNEGATTNFSAVATSDAEMVPNYQWFVVTNTGAFPGDPLTGIVANGTNFTMASIPALYNHAQVYCVASTEEGTHSITSSVSILTVIQSVFEVGYVSENKWIDQFNRAGIEAGTLGTPTFSAARPGFEAGLDNPGSWPHDSALQQIGYFIAPADGNYVFFFTSHDDGDLFLSTDNTAAHKVLVAREEQWANNWEWSTDHNGGNSAQKRSDTFKPTGSSTAPYVDGIPLLAGHHYYMEVAHDTSKWGNEQEGVYYAIMNINGVVTAPADGTPPNAVGTNVAMSAIRCSSVAFTAQPSTSGRTVQAGSTIGFSVSGTTDSLYPIESAYGYTITQPQNKLFTQWYKILGGVTNAIPGATGTAMVDGPLTSADTGAQYYCSMRALGYADDLLNPIWTNSATSGSITVVTAVTTSNLLGHFISGAADLNDTANYVSPGLYYGVPARATTSSQFYYFTNDVPPGKTGVSLFINNDAIAITNTCPSDNGYVVDTFNGGIANAFTVMVWAKGNLSAWNAFVTKGGDNGIGWAIRTGNNGDRACWTLRGSGGTEDMFGPHGNNSLWHHYAGVYDKATGIRTLYVDGNQQNQYTGQTAYTPANGHLTLGTEDLGQGNSFGNNGYITGELFDVRIYNYSLSQGAVALIAGINPPLTTTFGTNSVGSKEIVMTYTYGTLLQATNVAGPWTPVAGAASPYTNALNNTLAIPDLFYKVSNP